MIAPPSKRRAAVVAAGRFSAFRRGPAASADPEATAEFVARRLLDRTGVVFRRTLVRERIPVLWRDLVRVLRRMELRGDVRGGRFVAGFDGEQYAWPRAVKLLRAVRRDGQRELVEVSPADPLNFRGILTPDARVSPQKDGRVAVG
jgi:ATP-dependent Lhr-like helicase